jgi:hypothetical protein
MPISPSQTRARRLSLLAVSLLAATGLLLAGCASTPAASGGERLAPSLGALFDQYLARSDLSAFEREVLTRAKQNGRITTADYETAHAKEASCMAAAGYNITYKKLPNGLYKNTPHLPPTTDNKKAQAQADAMMTASAECAKGVSMIIEALYTAQQGNPDLFADPFTAAVQCLRKAGLVPGDYTAETLSEQYEKSFQQAPFDPNADAAQACLTGAGIAFASSPETSK